MIYSNLPLFQGLGPFKDMTLGFPEEEWRHVAPAQIDCFGEYVDSQDCGAPPGKTLLASMRRRCWELQLKSLVLAMVLLTEQGGECGVLETLA